MHGPLRVNAAGPIISRSLHLLTTNRHVLNYFFWYKSNWINIYFTDLSRIKTNIIVISFLFLFTTIFRTIAKTEVHISTTTRVPTSNLLIVICHLTLLKLDALLLFHYKLGPIKSSLLLIQLLSLCITSQIYIFSSNRSTVTFKIRKRNWSSSAQRFHGSGCSIVSLYVWSP